MWTKEALNDLVSTRLKDYQLIVVANREPFIHRQVGKRLECIVPASGMATALDPIMRACGGVWVAHGSGNADRAVVDEHDHVQVPPDDPRYTLRRVWLTKGQELGYYYGLANGALWPLCHITFTRPIFEQSDWDRYCEVNRLFAQAVLEEAGNKPTFVFVQDYHFALLPRYLKQANSNLIVAQFWHIPWPNRETFRAFPWKEELLDGLLGNDLLGFHLRYHCQNVLDTVDRSLEARVDQERSEITRHGKVTVVRPFPISIDFDEHLATARSHKVDSFMDGWRVRLGLQNELIGIGVDRIDYTKGIPERFQALDRFFAKNPGYRGKLVFVQIGVPSRSHIPQYKTLDDELDKLVEEINWKWSEGSWRPIIFLKEHHGQTELMALHRLADFCIVSSLHDGLNLVAKEYVASRFDEGGMLILSQFTGAARELTDALLVNPFAVEEIAAAVLKALEMPPAERARRMKRMREAVANNNVYRWAGKVISALLKFDFPESSNGAAGGACGLADSPTIRKTASDVPPRGLVSPS
jgi:trehalose 6-phosphate synthase